MLKSLKLVATAAVVLAIPFYAVYGLTAGASCPNSQLSADFHVYSPVGPVGARAAGSLSAAEEIELRSWVFTWGSTSTPPPKIQPTI